MHPKELGTRTTHSKSGPKDNMKKAILLLLLLQVFCAAGFSQNLRFTEPFEIHIPARADLEVRWNAPTNKLPPSIWVYHLLPRKLSPEILSNLMVACSFTFKDGTRNGDLLIFKSSDGSRDLRVSWPSGTIDYNTTETFSPTNLVKDVPSNKQTIKLAEKFLPKLGINLADIEKKENSSEPEFHPFQWGGTYFVDHKPIHEIRVCEIHFKRAVDGIPFLGYCTGGSGEIKFGERGRIVRILITWRNMQRDKLYPASTPEMMVKSIREGKAIQEPAPDNSGGIDWRTVKSVTVKKAEPCYYAGGDHPSDWLEPYAALWATVDTGHGNIDVEIDCPIIDPPKRPKGDNP